jgi:hypothetical protein
MCQPDRRPSGLVHEAYTNGWLKVTSAQLPAGDAVRIIRHSNPTPQNSQPPRASQWRPAMADQASLQVIGLLFTSITALVTLVAVATVGASIGAL